MAAREADRGDQAIRLLAGVRRDRHYRELLERAEAQLRSSAARLRVTGASAQARRVEQFAEWARLDLDEPQATWLMYRALRDARASGALGLLLDGVLDFALELLHADRGNVQLADRATGKLRIFAQRGFDRDFLDYFAVVTDGGSACGRAARQHAQVAITDVRTDPGFAPHQEIAAASGFRAVQSTPLTTRDGRLVGMVSTHSARPVAWPDRDLLIIRRFGMLIGERLNTLLTAPRSPVGV